MGRVNGARMTRKRRNKTLQLGSLIQVGCVGALLGEPLQQLPSDVGMGHLAATETNGDLDAVAVGDELLRVPELRVEIADVDARRHADFLDLHNVLILLGLLLPLALLELELAVVHQLAHGGHGLRRDLHQVQSLLISDPQGLGGRHDAQLGAVITDQADLLVANVLIQFMHCLTNGRSTSIQNITKRGRRCGIRVITRTGAPPRRLAGVAANKPPAAV